MLRFLLDTNIAIYTIKNRPQQVRERFVRFQGSLGLSTVSLMELLFGAEKSSQPERNERDIQGFAARLEVLDYGVAAVAHTGQIRAHLARLGTPIGPYDAMIAGHARANGLVLVTNNVAEFARVPGLMLENWA